jgi:hypothetical protein
MFKSAVVLVCLSARLTARIVVHTVAETQKSGRNLTGHEDFCANNYVYDGPAARAGSKLSDHSVHNSNAVYQAWQAVENGIQHDNYECGFKRKHEHRQLQFDYEDKEASRQSEANKHDKRVPFLNEQAVEE